MKTANLCKVMMAVVFAMASVLTMNAAEPTKVTNVEMSNGKVTARVVYLQDGQYLTPSFRFEFIYDGQSRITEKKVLKWDDSMWVNYYCITATYEPSEAHLLYSIWDEKAHEFRPTEKYGFQLDVVDEFLTQY